MSEDSKTPVRDFVWGMVTGKTQQEIEEQRDRVRRQQAEIDVLESIKATGVYWPGGGRSKPSHRLTGDRDGQPLGLSKD